MAMAVEAKQQIIQNFQAHSGDTGSPEVQVAILSQRIKQLTGHLKAHVQDVHSRRGLLAMVNKRRRLLHYLMKKNEVRYKEVIGKIGLSR